MSEVKIIHIKKDLKPVFDQFLKEREAFTKSLKESGKKIYAALSPKVER
jgi:hypothetical protein